MKILMNAGIMWVKLVLADDRSPRIMGNDPGSEFDQTEQALAGGGFVNLDMSGNWVHEKEISDV